MDQKNKKQISNEEFDKQIGLHIKQESEKADAMAFEIFKNAFTADNLYTKQGIC